MAEPVAAVIGGERHAGVGLPSTSAEAPSTSPSWTRGPTHASGGTAGVAVGGELLDGCFRGPWWARRSGSIIFLTSSTTCAPPARRGSRWPIRDPVVLARIGGDAGTWCTRFYEGHAYDFYRAIEDSGESSSLISSRWLSRTPLGLDVPIRRSAFEAMIRRAGHRQAKRSSSHERGRRHGR